MTVLIDPARTQLNRLDMVLPMRNEGGIPG